MKLLYICIGLAILSALYSCEKELDMRYHDISPLTVIEGELTPDGIKVGITLTTPMDEPMDRTRLTDAEVSLTDITAGTEYCLDVDCDGYFVNATPGIVGHEYRLRVRRDDYTYEAATVMCPPVEFLGLRFNWIKMPYDYVAVLQGQFMDVSDSDDYFWIKIYRNGEIYKWIRMNDSGDVGGVLTFLTMTSRMDTDEEDESDVLYDGDVMSVSVSGISRSMYDYIEALENDSNGPAMFSGDKCLGYFLATSPVSQSVVFRPSEIEEYR